jgi:GWxTD domain-containing protein
MNKLLALICCLALGLASCKTSQPRERSYNKPYKKTDNELSGQFFLYHGINSTSFIYYRIDNSQLLYKKVDTSGAFTARVTFSYIFRADPDSRQVLDSGTVLVEDKVAPQPQQKVLIGYIPLKVDDGADLYLELTVQDQFGRKSHTRYIHCDKRNPYTQQNYLLQDKDRNIIFSNKIELGTVVTVNNSHADFSFARIDFFANDNSLPLTAFSQKQPVLYPSIPDSTFTVASPDKHSFNFTVARQGIYYIRLDSENVGGCTVLGVEKNFPKVQSHTQMVASSLYIMTRDEHQKVLDASDKQAAIEAFWIGLAGNQDRARELIKRYYNRVETANRLFTSHIEGWKTDMGMIYVVFGTPTKTYKTAGMETWVYGIENSPNSVTFRFEKVQDPFSENCYKLIRDVRYRDPWYLAVLNWREGRVYQED